MDDQEELAELREQANACLKEFVDWQGVDKSRPDGALLYLGLRVDIETGDRTELQRLITRMTELNSQSMMQKLSRGV